MSRFMSPELQSLTPYQAGEQPKDQKYVKLNTNECPYPPSPKVVEVIKNFDTDLLKLYPDPDSTKLNDAIRAYYNLEQSEVFIGNGSDEVLALAFMTFFKQEKPLLYPNISYSFYPVYCDLYDIKAEQQPLTEDFDIDLASYPTDNGGIIFPNPNAPTGRPIALADIEALVERNRESLIIVDEAYVDFGGETAIPLTEKYDNVLVVQTLSKSRSLAGMRVGFAVGNKELIAALNTVKNSFNSYPLDKIAIEAATAAMEDTEYFEECCKKIIETREWTTKELKALDFTVLPSTANFIFAKPNSYKAEDLYKNLKKEGVLVRYWNKPLISDYTRITIGTPEEMEILITKTKKLLGK